MSDLIAAIATGSIATAIGIVRVSGDGCFAACDRVFRPRNGVPFAQQTSHKMVFGEMLDDSGAVIDQGLAVRFGGGHSYTGEDSAEFHCHGSPVVLHTLLSALFAAGARQAQAGEFTKRAFLNGKMDLTEAEAVIDLIDAQSAAAAKNAAAQLDGGLRRRLEPVQAAHNAVGQLEGVLSRTVAEIYDGLMAIVSRFYAVVDYPDEDIEDIQPQQIRSSLQIAADTLSALLDTAQRGRVLKNGVRTAIVGLPNAGKSSLLNALAGYDRAIVTDIPGTTRDTVEETVTCGGTLLRLIDTAGIHDTADAVEQLGVERSRRAAETADLVIAVVDGSQTPPTVDEDILSLSAQAPHWILAVSKNDLNPAAKTAVWQLPKELRDPDAFVSFNSVAPGGLDLLVDAVQSCFPAETPADAGSLLTNARQESAVRRSLEAVRRALSALDSGLTPDAVLTDAEEALESIGELTGRTAKEEIVGAVFSRFCVGK